MEDYPLNLVEFEARFSTEEGCRDYLCQLRWPDARFAPRSIPDNRSCCTFPWRLIERNSGPVVTAAYSNPGLKDSNRAGLGIRSIRNTDLAARSVLVRLGPAQRHGKAILAEGAIPDVQAN